MKATEKKSGRNLLKVGFLTAAGFLVWYSAVWFGIAFAPLLVGRNAGLRATAQPGSRAPSTNTVGEFLSGGRTLVSAFRYVIAPDPTGIAAVAESSMGWRPGNLALLQSGLPPWMPDLSSFSNSASLTESNTWRAATEYTNDAG